MILIKVRNGELFFSRKKIHIAKQDEHMVKKRTTERWREGEGKKDGWVSWVEQRKQQNVILFCWKKKSPMAMIMNLFGSYRTRRGSVLPSHLCNLKLGGKRAHKMPLIRTLQQEQWVHKTHCLDSWKRNGTWWISKKNGEKGKKDPNKGERRKGKGIRSVKTKKDKRDLHPANVAVSLTHGIPDMTATKSDEKKRRGWD